MAVPSTVASLAGLGLRMKLVKRIIVACLPACVGVGGAQLVLSCSHGSAMTPSSSPLASAAPTGGKPRYERVSRWSWIAAEWSGMGIEAERG